MIRTIHGTSGVSIAIFVIVVVTITQTITRKESENVRHTGRTDWKMWDSCLEEMLLRHEHVGERGNGDYAGDIIRV